MRLGPRPPAAADGQPARPRQQSALRNAVEWVVIIAGALLAAFVIKTWLLQAFYIPSESMEPTLHVQDRVLVNKLSYRLHEVNRGDIVVFERPPAEADGVTRDLIKRVIAVEGDTIESRDGTVYLNGRRLREPYLAEPRTVPPVERQVVPAGKVFVMGDNRDNSKDSRFFGPVDQRLIVGRAFVRLWPVSAIGLL